MEILNNLIPDKLFETLPLVGLYAESHFRFRIPFSRYFKREPELIFDTPWRLEPGQTPTVFLVVKDAHLYPVTLVSAEIEVYQKNMKVCTQSWQLDDAIDERQTHLSFALSECDLPRGEVDLLPILRYTINGRQKEMRIDNYAQIEKQPLRVTISDEKLPVLPGWKNGDTHLHSSLTNDQIEFGASLDQTREAAQLFGLDFITITDHSYDLDDLPEDYLTNDPDLVKWKESRDTIEAMNQEDDLTVIPGEEISVANARGSTVHFLHFNDPTYFPGSGDSGEDWPNLKSQLTIDDILAQRSPDTVSIGAHTAYKFPWFQRVLLNRGFWEARDHQNPELDGVQILCGTPAFAAFQASRKLWIDALLEGKKLGAYGGSDGHGNFNRNWHVTLPVWSLGIHEDQIFAQSRTLIRSESNSTAALMQAMKNRRSAVSTGPVGDLSFSIDDKNYGIGDTAAIKPNVSTIIKVKGMSSAEFGAEMDVTLYLGNIETQTESILHHEVDLNTTFDLDIPFAPLHSGYLRMEISSEGSRWPGVYVSSPIWINLMHTK